MCNGVEMSWNTLSEWGTAGYLIYRSEGASFVSAEQVSEEMIMASGGGEYGLTDASAKAERSYTYWLVEVGVDGREEVVASVTTTAQGCVR